MSSSAASAPAEQERLAALAAYDVVGLDAGDPVRADLDAVCELAAGVLGVRNAVVNLIDDRVQHQVAAFGVDPTDCRRDESLCQTTLAAGHDVAITDAAADARYADSPWVDGRLGRIRRYASAILRTPAGLAIGTLCAFDDTPGDISTAQRRGLRLLADRVVGVLELRLRGRQLEDANEQLRRSQDRLAAFAGQISHDLKAPVTAILGFAELLEDTESVAADASAAAYVQRCASAAGRMLAMIDDMLAFARIGATLEVAPVPLGSVVPEVLADLDGDLGDADVTWSGPDLLADRVQLRAVLQNLLQNALVYRGEAVPRIVVSTEVVGPETVLRVVDNGPGIPAGSREEVLRPLVRLRKDVPGAGLGLAVCVRVLQAHNGSIRLEEAPGGGTAAIARFPGVAVDSPRG